MPKKAVKFNMEDRTHIRVANSEMGALCSRVGTLEGKVDMGFGDIKSMLNKLPCAESFTRLNKLETDMAKNKGASGVKDRILWAAMGAGLSAAVALLVWGLTGR